MILLFRNLKKYHFSDSKGKLAMSSSLACRKIWYFQIKIVYEYLPTKHFFLDTLGIGLTTAVRSHTVQRITKDRQSAGLCLFIM